jgi:hypothetical protein
VDHPYVTTRRLPEAQQVRIWSGCLPELPQCSVEGCDRHAVEVDAFFPYLDDRNRCDFHSVALQALPTVRAPRRLYPHCH